MAAFFICYGLQSIRCENTDFTNLNNLILKALFSVPRFIFGHFEGSDDIFHQTISISKLNQMLNSHFGSTFMLGNWFGNLGLKNGLKNCPMAMIFDFLRPNLVGYLKII